MKLRAAALALSAAFAALLSHPSAASFPRDDRSIVHVLNRVAFGARPGDLEKIRAIGLQQYIEQQLHPERIDNQAMNARLADLRTIAMSSREISEQFEQPMLAARQQRQRAAANG